MPRQPWPPSTYGHEADVAKGGLLEGKADSEATLSRVVHTNRDGSMVWHVEVATDHRDRTVRVGGDLEAD
jgi:hypothetical protein